ncbi:MAG: outer membrane beta-barrel protein [Alphaproteobacteria bacterium]|nr:outer membrane beta-barrel protein [Alphaproteobacteria bacterium]
MKLKLALAAATMLCAPALMSAQAQEANVYLNGGYTQFDGKGADPGALTGRVGVGFGKYFAVEGEGSVGIHKDSGVKLDSEIGAYGVAKLPIGQRFDIFARAGAARTDFSPGGDDSGFAYGAGGDFFFTDHDGIRADWTRHDYNDLDSYSLAYVRRF